MKQATNTNNNGDIKAEIKTSKNGKGNKRKAERAIPLILNDESPFLIKEAYKAARANVNFSLAGTTGCKRIVVTSSAAAEGKTTTCINLAIAFAQSGAKVLLIDSDMRKSSIHNYLGIKNTMGLSNVLGGCTQLNEIIKKTTYGFDCMTAGPIPPNPSELLLTSTAEELMETLSEYYDYIFIDTPPVAMVSDALSMINYVDGYIVTVRESFTLTEHLKKTVNALKFANAKILGFILNDSQNGEKRYGYRYKYRSRTYKEYYGSDEYYY